MSLPPVKHYRFSDSNVASHNKVKVYRTVPSPYKIMSRGDHKCPILQDKNSVKIQIIRENPEDLFSIR